MTKTELNRTLKSAVDAAKAVGVILRRNLNAAKRINDSPAHDIKLELDVRCQQLIEGRLHKAFPQITLLGEEDEGAKAHGELRWVVDPIDGTVNFSSGIPHACVCIALQQRSRSKAAALDHGYRTILGVVYDPFLNEMWTAIEGGPALLNGRRIRVSSNGRLIDSVVAMGFGKNEKSVRHSLKLFSTLSVKALKVRNMGSAGLALAYVASGRFGAYIEQGINLWDVAAGGFILERAGGEYWRQPGETSMTYRMIASNGRLRNQVQRMR